MEKVIFQKINKEVQGEIEKIFNAKKLGKYEEILKEELGKDRIDAKKLFQTGVDALPPNEKRPDFELSTYFFCLSELKDIPDAARSFAMDAMVYSETDMYDGLSETREKIIEEFKEIAPTLR